METSAFPDSEPGPPGTYVQGYSRLPQEDPDVDSSSLNGSAEDGAGPSSAHASLAEPQAQLPPFASSQQTSCDTAFHLLPLSTPAPDSQGSQHAPPAPGFITQQHRSSNVR